MTQLEKKQDEFIKYLLSILTPECKTLYKAIKVDGFKQSISQLQEGEMYPREFVEWYSGMESEKIERAYQRWIKESKVKPK